MKSYKLTTKRLDRITPAERRRLNYLTLKTSKDYVSMMREDILQRQKMLHRIQLFLVKDMSGTIVAWSSVMPATRNYAYIYTYVMQIHRRRGLGTRLINRAMIWCNKQSYKPRVISWDTASNQFFSTVTSKVKVDLADLT